MARTIKYQDPSFNRDQYWLDRKASPGDKRAARTAKRVRLVVAVHDSPDWPRKQPTKKAVIKNTKRARKFITYAS